MTAVPPASTPDFDPFLRNTPGAEVRSDARSIRRAISLLVDHEVMCAATAGGIQHARLLSDGVLRFRGPSTVEAGETVAISEHHGLRYVGFRAAVLRVEASATETRAWLGAPNAAVFYPGRQHIRLDGVLGARVTLEMGGALIAARGLDISLGGVGVEITAQDGFVMGEPFTLHLDFVDGHIAASALVRSALPRGQIVRLGVEFAGHLPELSRRIRAAMETDEVPHLDEESCWIGRD